MYGLLKVVSDPILLDFIRVVLDMDDDQKAHVKAMTGRDYDVDGLALGAYTTAGPKWCIKHPDGAPMAVGGFAIQRPGVYRDFFMFTREAFRSHNAVHVTRVCRTIMRELLKDPGVHRLECMVPVARVKARPELDRWYRILGYKNEALHSAYCADGTAAYCYARVKL